MTVIDECAHCKNEHARFVTTERFVRQCYGYREHKWIDYFYCDECKRMSYRPCVITNTTIPVPQGIAKRLESSPLCSSVIAADRNKG